MMKLKTSRLLIQKVKLEKLGGREELVIHMRLKL